MASVPGQRSAQRPMRAALASSRALGRAAAPAGGMSGRLHVRLTGHAPYVLEVDEVTGGEVRTTSDGRSIPEGRTAAPAESEEG